MKKAPALKKPATYTIRPSEIEVGMFVVVEEWYEARGATVGVPLKVVGIALPLITVQYCPNTGIRGVMDTRQMKLTRVGLRYVRSLVPNYGKKAKAADAIDNSDAFGFGYIRNKEI